MKPHSQWYTESVTLFQKFVWKIHVSCQTLVKDQYEDLIFLESALCIDVFICSRHLILIEMPPVVHWMLPRGGAELVFYFHEESNKELEFYLKHKVKESKEKHE